MRLHQRESHVCVLMTYFRDETEGHYAAQRNLCVCEIERLFVECRIHSVC